MVEEDSSGLAVEQGLWPLAAGPWRLCRGTARVFKFELDLVAADVEQLARTLSTEELERAARFRFARDRARFVVGRGVVRNVLASCLGTSPQELDFITGARGKPNLTRGCNPMGLHFNLSHSGGLALLGATLDGPIGVDLEQVRDMPDAAELVRRFFSLREQTEYQRLPPCDRLDAFFNLWTRKEAWLKATGDGISELLHRVEVSFAPGVIPALLALPDELKAKGEWYLQALEPAPGFIGALALPVRTVSVVHQWWRAKHSLTCRPAPAGACRAGQYGQPSRLNPPDAGHASRVENLQNSMRGNQRCEDVGSLNPLL